MSSMAGMAAAAAAPLLRRRRPRRRRRAQWPSGWRRAGGSPGGLGGRTRARATLHHYPGGGRALSTKTRNVGAKSRLLLSLHHAARPHRRRRQTPPLASGSAFLESCCDRCHGPRPSDSVARPGPSRAAQPECNGSRPGGTVTRPGPARGVRVARAQWRTGTVPVTDWEPRRRRWRTTAAMHWHIIDTALTRIRRRARRSIPGRATH